MRRWADLMIDHQEDLAALLTTEQGKPLAESRVEVAYAASFLEWFGEEAKRVYGDTIPTYMRDRRIVVTKEPVGVTAGITPWNFPAAMPTRKAAPALGAGCTMVLKPAEQTPLTALAVMRLGEEAGPAARRAEHRHRRRRGRAASSAREMTSNPLVRKLGFTGSTEVGKLLMAQCAGQVKKVSLELGGNAPFIVFDDADLEAAVAGALTCKYRNSGQTCISANRILVQDGDLRRLPGRLHRGRDAARRGRRLHRERQRRAADRPARHREGPAPRRRRARARRRAAARRRAPRAGAAVLRADRDDRHHRGDGDEQRGDLRPRGRHHPLRHRGGGGGQGQRHALRPVGLLLLPRHGPHLARLRSARVRDPRHQHRRGVDRGRAVRRRQGVGHRPRGIEVRHRRVARDQVPVHGRRRECDRRGAHLPRPHGQAARGRAALRRGGHRDPAGAPGPPRRAPSPSTSAT